MTATPSPMSVDDARRLVMDWSNPDGDAHVDRSGSVAADDAAKALSAAGVEELPFFGGEIGSMDVPVPPSWIPTYNRGPLIFVEVTQRGTDMRSADQAGSGGGVCYPVAGDRRYTVTAVFDGATGTYLGFLKDPLPADLWRLASAAQKVIRSLRTATATVAATVTMTRRGVTATATAEYVTGESAGALLAEGHVPGGVRPMVEVAPWVSGSWWAYQQTGVADGIQWWTTTVTETVEEARRLAPNAMAARLGWQAAATSDRFRVSPWAWLPNSWGRSSVYVLPRSVYWPKDFGRFPVELSVLQARDEDGASAKLPDGSADQPSEMIRLPLHGGDEINYWWSVGRPETIGTPAGTFTGCYPLTEFYGNDSHWTHWLCPGVGFVRHERWGCTSFNGSAVVYEMTDYHVPPIVPGP